MKFQEMTAPILSVFYGPVGEGRVKIERNQQELKIFEEEMYYAYGLCKGRPRYYRSDRR